MSHVVMLHRASCSSNSTATKIPSTVLLLVYRMALQLVPAVSGESSMHGRHHAAQRNACSCGAMHIICRAALQQTGP